MKQNIIDEFYKLFMSEFKRKWRANTWFGVAAWKCPFDLWVMQELLYRIKPDYLIETGTAYGGSALYYAHLFDIAGHGEVITIDDNSGKKGSRNRKPHDRITYITGSSVDKRIVNHVSELVEGTTVLVNLDSCHTEAHVYEELIAWSPIVSVGSYLVVEDTVLDANLYGPGPMEAVQRWLIDNSNFQIDFNCEKFLLTFNPSGYLKRLS